MSTNFHDLMSSQEIRRAQHIAYSVCMVGDVAGGYDDAVDHSELAFARCMIDAFYVHVRLLADFLVRGTNENDFGPSDFGVEWVTPDREEAGRLNDHWNVASKFVVHFGRPRVPDDADDLQTFPVGGEHFRSIATDVLTVFGDFVRAVESATPPWHDGSRIPDRANEPNAWQARNLSNRAMMLREALTH